MKARKKISNKAQPALSGLRLRRLELLTFEAISAMLVVVVGSFFLAGIARFFIGSTQTASVVSAILVDLTNVDRTTHNLQALHINETLVAAAQAKANDMASKGYFAHTAPDGTDPWHWFKEAGYVFSYAGENLAIDFSDSVDVEKAWMDSPAHRDNILDPHYTEIGIAVAEGMYQGRHTIFVVQEFGAPKSEPDVSKVAIETNIPSSPEILATAASVSAQKLAAETVTNRPTDSQSVLGTSIDTEASSGLEGVLSQSTKKLPANSFDIAAATPIGYALSAPRDALRSVYFTLSAFLLLLLAYTTRFEMKKHHLKHVFAVSGVVATMAALFFVASYYVFTSPLILDRGAAAMHHTY